VLAAGVRIVQYRNKSGVDHLLVRELRARASRSDAFLIVNDDLEAGLEADGFHAGQEDLARLDPRRVRERLGARLFGVSCGTPAEARSATQAGADYLGVGPFAPTSTKSDAGPPLGEAGLRAVAAASPLPVAAIGGITRSDLPALVRAGARMAAVVSAIARAPDPEAAARELIAAWAELAG